MENTHSYITLALHTREAALKLKESLEFHNIPVHLEEVKVEGLEPSPLNVCIPTSSLKLGLKILESGELNTAPLKVMKLTGMSNILLIPVDFSESSMLAVRTGFYLAKRLQLKPVILHAYFASPLTLVAPFGTNVDDNQIEEAEEEQDLLNFAENRINKLKNTICKFQKEELLPELEFEVKLVEGVAEQAIHDYVKSNRPLMIVMTTRGINKKGADLIGSVTAEVIDACKVPVLAVPDTYELKGVDNIKKVLLLCSLTRFDIITLRGLMRTFDFPSCDFYLAAMDYLHYPNSKELIVQLKNYFEEIYPTANFHIVDMKDKNFDDNIKHVLNDENIQLIIAPNKKVSPLARFFKPTLAHKILFEKDVPLLALPFSSKKF